MTDELDFYDWMDDRKGVPSGHHARRASDRDPDLSDDCEEELLRYEAEQRAIGGLPRRTCALPH